MPKGRLQINHRRAIAQGDHFLIREQNAVPFDPNAGWKEGDMIPDYIVSREDAKGSAADNNAIASWKDGIWTVVMIRPLGLTNSDDKALKAGEFITSGLPLTTTISPRAATTFRLSRRLVLVQRRHQG